LNSLDRLFWETLRCFWSRDQDRIHDSFNKDTPNRRAIEQKPSP
jgi:hypothetical protein